MCSFSEQDVKDTLSAFLFPSTQIVMLMCIYIQHTEISLDGRCMAGLSTAYELVNAPQVV